MSKPLPLLVLIVIDGFGISSQDKGNAIKKAKKPTFDMLFQNYPWGLLNASSMDVGVDFGEPGNSEVGHLGIGAGTVVYQNLPRIKMAIEDKSFSKNKALLGAIAHAKKNKGRVHIVGLCSAGGVHAHIEHLESLLDMCKAEKCTNVAIHMITDGRDTPAKVAEQYLTQTEKKLKQLGGGCIATVGGRFFGMDRDNNWSRIEKMYTAMAEGKGPTAPDAKTVITKGYKDGKNDENLDPTVIVDKDGAPLAAINDGDAVIFFNYREDRARQLTKAFVDKKFDGFKRAKSYKNLKFVTFVEYEKGLDADVAFPPQLIEEPLGKIIASAGKKQLRIAETEKYAHVTYFFNGGAEEEFPGEERVLIPSKKVESYADKPEMSAKEITDRVLKEIDRDRYAFILMNFANPDMVGHTGEEKPTITAVQVVDECLGKIIEKVLSKEGVVVITADHGNAEQKVDPLSGKNSKEHTSNPVPLIVVDASRKREKAREEVEALLSAPQAIGILADVAPTICELMGLKPAKAMTGRSLLKDLS